MPASHDWYGRGSTRARSSEKVQWALAYNSTAALLPIQQGDDSKEETATLTARVLNSRQGDGRASTELLVWVWFRWVVKSIFQASSYDGGYEISMIDVIDFALVRVLAVVLLFVITAIITAF